MSDVNVTIDTDDCVTPSPMAVRPRSPIVDRWFDDPSGNSIGERFSTQRSSPSFCDERTETYATHDIRSIRQSSISEPKVWETTVISKNCQTPEWNETITIELTANQARDCLQQICSISTPSSVNGGGGDDRMTIMTTEASVRESQIRNGCPTIDCMIYDHDVLSFNDPMGIVQIPVTLEYFRRNEQFNTNDDCSQNSLGPQWYTVGTQKITYLQNGSDASVTSEDFCANATGELNLNVQVQAQWMVHINEFISYSQQRVLLSSSYSGCSNDNRDGNLDLELSWITGDTATLIDTACIAIDQRNGKIDMEQCIYYHNLVNPNSSIQSTSSATTVIGEKGTTMGNPNTKITTVFHTETYSITLPLLPDNISMLYFAVFASQPRQYLTNDIVSTMSLRVINRDTKKGICAYTLLEHTAHGKSNDNATPTTSTALVMAQLVRSPNLGQYPGDPSKDVWSIRPVLRLPTTAENDGVEGDLAKYDIGRDFGTIIPELKQLVYESKHIPNMVLPPYETRIGLMRKGGSICLKDYTRQYPDDHPDATSDDHTWSFAVRWENSTIGRENRMRQMKGDSPPSHQAPLKYEMKALLFSGEDHTDLNFQCIETIQTNHPQSNFDQSVCCGDKMLDDEEYMSVRLSKLPKYVTCVALMLHLNSDGVPPYYGASQYFNANTASNNKSNHCEISTTNSESFSSSFANACRMLVPQDCIVIAQ